MPASASSATSVGWRAIANLLPHEVGLLVSGDGLTFIYISIGMSAVAALLLVIAVRASKPATTGPAAPAPLEPEPERELAPA